MIHEKGKKLFYVKSCKRDGYLTIKPYLCLKFREMDNELRHFYSEKIVALTDSITVLRRYNTTFVLTELGAFVAMLACLVVYTITFTGIPWLILAGFFLLGYYTIRSVDSSKSRKVAECERKLRVYQNELSYLNGDFSCFDAGNHFVDPHHPFTFDLDIFGTNSLYHRMNRTVTTGGSEFMAAALSQTKAPSIADMNRRREAITELAEREFLRTAFIAQADGAHIDTDSILEALRGVRMMKLSQKALNPISLVMAYVSMIVFYGLFAGAITGWVPASWPLLWVVIQIMAVFLLFGRTLKKINNAINIILPRLSTYVGLIMQIVESDLKSTESQRIIHQLSAGDNNAINSFRQLKRILNELDQRNEIWVPFSNALYLSDYFIVRRFLQWQQHYMPCIEEWIDAVSHFDALVSMATFRYNEPLATDAEVVEAQNIVYDAKGLYHPFLGINAVSNDFSIDDGHYYIITGANMAGKSTFLRSVGINYVLALCSLPVFADHLKVSRFALYSSMRTSDDLAQGISYFNAELLRLQQLIRYCKQNQSTLIILDEILKGTNSLDKLNGSRLFLQNISNLPVTGIVATHDLELSRMADTQPDRFHNYCFEIKLSDQITYSYRITKGVARNQNATYLLKRIISENE